MEDWPPEMQTEREKAGEWSAGRKGGGGGVSSICTVSIQYVQWTGVNVFLFNNDESAELHK